MSEQGPIKLIPRNTAALRRGQSQQSATRVVSGNPVSTRLESGVGNCFPGLECDLRNLERRFFPFLEVDIRETASSLANIVSVDSAGVQSALAAGTISTATGDIYRLIARDLSQASRRWVIERISGVFGPLGNLTLRASDLQLPSAGRNRRPPDAWTAIRMLSEDTEVQLVVRRGTLRRTLAGNRSRYLDDNGALAKMFSPGELTQSLCSPWTHDFRDCGCFYWASNHPDIAKPALSSPPPSVPEINADVPWERNDRSSNSLPAPATSSAADELSHYEINAKWQTLNFVLEGRETLTPYEPGSFSGQPLSTAAELESNLRYAAGVELAVVHEYLAAAFSLRRIGLAAALVDDVTAAHAELIRIAIGEMRHLRAVNDVLASLKITLPFVPALRVASRVPGAQPGTFRAVRARAARLEVIQEFIEIEQPSRSVDGLYARILATLQRDGTEEQVQSIRSIMSEGEDHFETFQFMEEWLGRHNADDYLRSPNLSIPPAGDPRHKALQQQYRTLLLDLFEGYRLGVPAGAMEINAARNSMLGGGGIQGAAEAVAAAGFLVAFDIVAGDPRFAPIDNP